MILHLELELFIFLPNTECLGGLRQMKNNMLTKGRIVLVSSPSKPPLDQGEALIEMLYVEFLMRVAILNSIVP